MIELRDYQLSSIAELARCWRERPLLVAPCGSGKTTIACEVIRRAVAKGGTCGFLVHRIELLDQATERLAQFGIEAGQVIAGRREKASPVQVASIQTLARRELPPLKVVIVDEAHHAVSKSWKRVLDHYAASGAAIVGMTATPFRLDGKGLGAVFGKIVVAASADDLVARELLVEPTIYAPEPPDLSGIRTVGGDYDAEQLEERLSQEGIVGKIVEHWTQLAAGKQTICYATTVRHSEYICQMFREYGVAAEHVDGTTPRLQRHLAQARLRAREVSILSNCQVYTEGVDLPSLECAIIARPTKSLCLWIQMQGRVMRACDGKEGALILDHAGNVRRLGLVTDPLEYDLHDKVKRKGAGAPPQCPTCFVVLKGGEDECPECGADLRPEPDAGPTEHVERAVRHRDGKLVKFERKDQIARYTELIDEAWRRGYKLGWARVRFKEERGAWPRGMRAIEEKQYPCADHAPEVVVYGVRQVTRCGRCMTELAPVPARELEEGWME